MRKPAKRQRRQNAKKSPSNAVKKANMVRFIRPFPKWDNGSDPKARRNPRFPNGFKKGDFVTIAKTKNLHLEDLRTNTYVYSIVGTCWIENETTGKEEEKAFRLRPHDPTKIVNENIDDYSDIEVRFSDIAPIDVSTLAIAAQRLNDLIKRIIKEGK